MGIWSRLPDYDDEEPSATLGRLRVSPEGALLPDETQRRHWGMTPGAEFTVQETPYGLILRRADPALARVYVEPTSACNLACRTCVRHSWSEPEGFMAMGTYRRLIEGLRSVPTLRSVSFWGFGEPLLHPEIVEMVHLAHDLGAHTDLITNGLLLDQAQAEGLVRAGLDRLVVSVDGASEEAYADARSGADLRQLRGNMEVFHAARQAARRRRPEIGIAFVAMRSNVTELGQLRRLAESLGATSITVTNVLPYTKELASEILYPLRSAASYPLRCSPWAPEVSLPRIDAQAPTIEALAKLQEHKGAVAPPAGWDGSTQGYCRFVSEGTTTVRWDGEVSPCVALMHSHTCYVLGREKRIRRCALGNVGQQAITAIWASEEYVRLRAHVRDFDFAPCTDCGGCELAESNEEDCCGSPFPVCGDCLWAKGAIQCP